MTVTDGRMARGSQNTGRLALWSLVLVIRWSASRSVRGDATTLLYWGGDQSRHLIEVWSFICGQAQAVWFIT